MAKYPAVSAAEKYAEVGDDRPACDCHGELMRWSKDGNYPDGGFWVCADRKRSVSRASRWNNLDTFKKRRKERYRNDPAFRQYCRSKNRDWYTRTMNGKDQKKIDSLMELLPQEVQTQLREVMQLD